MVASSPSFGKWYKHHAAWASTLRPDHTPSRFPTLKAVPKFYCVLCFSATTGSADQRITDNAFLGEVEMTAEAIGYMDFSLCVKSQNAK